MRLIDEYNIDVLGKKVVVIGKSNIVGLPISLMLMKRNATVTICHKHTGEDILKKYTQEADIIISCCGQPKMIKKEWIKEGVIIIDIGINKIAANNDTNNSTKKSLIVGDVDFEDVKDKVSAISPVPGGVGPMTIASLMKNTVIAAERHLSK